MAVTFRDGFGGVEALTLGMPSLARALEPPPAEVAMPERAATFDEVYAAHFAFVWRVLRTFGVAEAGIEDAVQDVFIVVHRRLADFEGRAAMTTWLFAIARRIASGYRRRTSGQRTEELVDDPVGTADTFAALSRAQAAATVMAILERMDEDKRAVFALVELEQMNVTEVATVLEINVNTAYSRLRLARAAFELAVRARVKP